MIATNILCACSVLGTVPSTICIVTRRIPVNGFFQSMCTMSTCVYVCACAKELLLVIFPAHFLLQPPPHPQAEVLGEGEL